MRAPPRGWTGGWRAVLGLLGLLACVSGPAWGNDPTALPTPTPTPTPTTPATTPAQQAPGPLVSLCERLDGELALGMGRVVARPRPTADPGAAQAPAPAGSELFVPRTREAHRREREANLERAMQAQQAEQKAKNDAFFANVVAQCGSAPIEAVHVGMAQDRFEQCSSNVRFGGGLTHVLTLEAEGHDARLYRFAQGEWATVCAVDGLVARTVARPANAQAVTLPQVGAYPPQVLNPHLVALAGGQVFGLGQAMGEDWSQPAGADLAAWANKEQRIHNVLPPPPLMWEAQRPGWQRVPPPPACEQGLWHQHTLTALADDRVLVAGGLCDIPRLSNDMGPFVPQARTALWDARQRAWLPSPNLAQPRIHHTASLLDGQRVMLVGGFDDPLTTADAGGAPDNEQKVPVALLNKRFIALHSVEMLMDDRWHTLPSLRTARAKHTATVLPSGGVLVVGGVGSTLRAIEQVEQWNPAQQRWEPRAPLRTPRYGHAATLLADGRVLVTGGINASEQALNTTELYDSATDTWAPGPPMPQHLQGHTALQLPHGRVLLAGGLLDATPSQPWLHSWHPSERAWRAEGMRDPNASNLPGHRPLLMPTAAGQVLAFGGHAVFVYGGEGKDAALDTPSFPAEWWQAPPAAVAPAAQAESGAAGQPGRLMRLGQDLWAARLQLGALALVLLLLWGLGRGRLGHADRAGRMDSPGLTGSKGGTGRSRVLRGLLVVALLVLALPNLLAYLHLQSADMADECRARPSACLDPDTGLLARQWAVPGRSKLASPRIPCAWVGKWLTRPDQREWVVALHANGTYTLHSGNGNGNSKPTDVGHWAVQGTHMLWRSTTQAMAEMDINPIADHSGTRFELVEANGLHSHFERQADLPRQSCEP